MHFMPSSKSLCLENQFPTTACSCPLEAVGEGSISSTAAFTVTPAAPDQGRGEALAMGSVVLQVLAQPRPAGCSGLCK